MYNFIAYFRHPLNLLLPTTLYHFPHIYVNVVILNTVASFKEELFLAKHPRYYPIAPVDGL